jgi:hypothetical protein
MGKDFDNVLGILKARQVPFDPEETRVRADLVMDVLRGKTGALKRLRAFGRSKQAGGAAGFPKLDLPAVPITVETTPGDYLGTEARWFIKAAGSPYLQALVRISFAVIFFLSYVEAIPIAGSLISASLDIALSGGRVLIKQLQGLVPTLVGLIPLPYMNLVGLGLVSIVGMVLWPLLAMISFSRQDFASAIESMIRVIPPPIGSALADTFLDANRTISKLDTKRKQVLADLMGGLEAIKEYGPPAAETTKKGVQKFISAVREVQEEVPTATAVPEPVPVTAPIAEPVPVAEPVAAPAPEPAPVAEPEPASAAAPPPPAAAPPPMSALDRLRSQKTGFTAPTQLKGGRRNTLSKKPKKTRKWKTRRHRMSARFSEPGSR